MLSFAALRRHVVSSDPASWTPGSPSWPKMPVVTASSPLDAQAELPALLAAIDNDRRFNAQ